jgi:hypothetical protein
MTFRSSAGRSRKESLNAGCDLVWLECADCSGVVKATIVFECGRVDVWLRQHAFEVGVGWSRPRLECELRGAREGYKVEFGALYATKCDWVMYALLALVSVNSRVGASIRVTRIQLTHSYY